jgi:hypothetical protein
MRFHLKRPALASATAVALLALGASAASAQNSTAAAQEKERPRHQGKGALSSGVETQALGGLSAPNARLAGLIDAGGAPIRTKAITSITRIDTGVYCIRPATSTGVNVNTAVVTLTPEYFYSLLNEVKVQWAAQESGCPAGQIGVYTLADPNRDGRYTFSNNVGFSIVVP